jgi:hypothetical protein
VLLTFASLIHIFGAIRRSERIKCFLAFHPRGLLFADFPNNFRSVFGAIACPPRGNAV